MDGRWSCAEDGVGVDVALTTTGLRPDRPGAQDHLGQQAEGAERSHEQPAEVVARHVLHRRTAGGDEPALGAHVARLEERVAHRADASRRMPS